MYGAILGDIIGSPYEFDRGDKTKDFPLFSRDSQFTDDSIMTLAVAEALMDTKPEDGEKTIQARLVKSMQRLGRKYPGAGYGCMFGNWLWAEDPQPYHSCGNGSAMRVAAAGWLYDDLETTRYMARLTASVTHDHPEGIKGAEAITAFLEGTDFEDVIRTAVSLGGDCDTLTCIAGSMAEAFYGVPETLKGACFARLSEELRKILGRFELFRKG